MDEQIKVLVTGGAGYIGSHTLLELLGDNRFDVVSADNFLSSTSKTFDRIEAISGKRVANHTVDLCDAAATRALFEKEKNIGAVIHFAALKSVPGSVANPSQYYHNNNESLKNILDCCREFHVQYFIFSSSCSVYGNIHVEDLPVNERTPLRKAESPYAETKQKGEQMLTEFAEKNPGTKCVALRYFNPIGAHPSGLIGEIQERPENLVPVILATATGKIKETVISGNDHPTPDHTCIRDYIHVCDIADAHVKALLFLAGNKEIKNHFLFNLGSGSGASVKQIIDAFEKVSGKTLNKRIGPRRPGDVSAIYSDCSEAEKVLGWKPTFSIEEMMATAWKWEQHRLGL